MDSGKCWPRRRPTRTERSLVLLLLAGAAGAASAQPAATAPAAPAQPPAAAATAATPATAAPTALQRFLASNVETLSGDFEQRHFTPAGNVDDLSTGTLAIKRPDRFRMHYTEPEEWILVSDGKQYMDYDVEVEQATIAKLDEVAFYPPTLLTGGAAAVDKAFKVIDSYAADGLEWVKLEPRERNPDVAEISVGFSGDLPRRIEVRSASAELTRLDLSSLAVNERIPDAQFEVKAPRGVAVIGDD